MNGNETQMIRAELDLCAQQIGIHALKLGLSAKVVLTPLIDETASFVPRMQEMMEVLSLLSEGRIEKDAPLSKSYHTPGGRTLYRHESGMGTVMEFNDGSPRKVLVLDAAYRDTKQWGTYGTDMSLTNYSTANTRGDWYLNTSNAANTNAATVMTDAQINVLWSASIDVNTAKQNCDVWMTKQGTTDTKSIVGVPAVAYARSIIVDGKGCDVPNIQTLMRIFLEADALDSFDPTAAARGCKDFCVNGVIPPLTRQEKR